MTKKPRRQLSPDGRQTSLFVDTRPVPDPINRPAKINKHFRKPEAAAETGPAVQSTDGWPDGSYIITNVGGVNVRKWLARQFLISNDTLIVVGYAGLLELTKMVAQLYRRVEDGVQVRIMLGNEPVPPLKSNTPIRLVPIRQELEDELNRYWIERGIRYDSCWAAGRTIKLIKRGIVSFRANLNNRTVHLKVYVTDDEALTGSSNASRGGLAKNLEANRRDLRDRDPIAYEHTKQAAERAWLEGEPYDDQIIKLLETLFDQVSPEMALARACVELTEGGFASLGLHWHPFRDNPPLPHQIQGIDQAAYILWQQGSVLIADPAGSGKTIIAAALLGATLKRLTQPNEPPASAIILCPPNVIEAWKRWTEGMTIKIYSLYTLHKEAHIADIIAEAKRCSILVIDEAHRLTGGSKRAKNFLRMPVRFRILTTATPADDVEDMVEIIEMVGADNLPDELILSVTQDVDFFKYRSRKGCAVLSDYPGMRTAFSQITLRRSREEIGEIIAQNPAAYARNGRVFRWPETHNHTYLPVGGAAWMETAKQILDEVDKISGLSIDPVVIQEHPRLEEPQLSRKVSEGSFRVHPAGRMLIRHNIIYGLLSSRAAALAVIIGPSKASRIVGYEPIQGSGDERPVRFGIEAAIKKLQLRAETQDPPFLPGVDFPEHDNEALRRDLTIADNIVDLLTSMSEDADEKKISLFLQIVKSHPKALVFDRHLATLGWMANRLKQTRLVRDGRLRVIVAAGKTVAKGGKDALRLFDPLGDDKNRAVILTGDALSEGVNLQKASAILMLSLPPTPTRFEQIVGRVDRIDSPHEHIDIQCSLPVPELPLFAHEKFRQRIVDTSGTLGMAHVPQIFEGDENFRDVMAERNRKRISDALDPVRQLSSGPAPLVRQEVIAEMRRIAPNIVGAKIAIVPSLSPWGFLCLKGFTYAADQGPPHQGRPPQWLLFDGSDEPLVTDPKKIVEQLRVLLKGYDLTASNPFDEAAQGHLDYLVERLKTAGDAMLPLAARRGLTQMKDVIRQWANASADEPERAERLINVHYVLHEDSEPQVDRLELARTWSASIAPFEADFRSSYKESEPYTSKRLTPALLQADRTKQDEIVARLEARLVAMPDLGANLVAFLLGMPPA